MGTRAIVIATRQGNIVGCAHRQMDGYPSGGTPGDIAALLKTDNALESASDVTDTLNSAARKRKQPWTHNGAPVLCYEPHETRVGWYHKWVYVVDMTEATVVFGTEREAVLERAGLATTIAIEP